MTEAENVRKRLGDFEILRELGRGGMGVVYEARQLTLNRKVALKVISSGLGLSSKAALRFQREAEAAGRLHHTNIVPIYSTGNEDGTHYYAMELIDGPSLHQVIQSLRRRRTEGSKLTASASTAAAGVAPIASATAAIGGSSAGGMESPEWVSDLLGPPLLPGSLTPPPTSSSPESSTSLRSSGEHFDTLATMIAGVADALDFAHENGVIHLCGEISAEGLIQATGRSKRNQTLAHHLIGMMMLADGDRAGARQHFEACVATHCFYFSTYEFSRAFLARMEKDPNWPPWIPVKDSTGAAPK